MARATPGAVGDEGSWGFILTNEIFIFMCRSHIWRRDLSSGSLSRREAWEPGNLAAGHRFQAGFS